MSGARRHEWDEQAAERVLSEDPAQAGDAARTPVEEVLRLQQGAGNAAVQRMLRPAPSTRRIARVVTVGGTLPQLEDLTATRAAKAMPRDDMRLIEKQALDSVRAAALTAAQATEPTTSATDADTIVAAYKAQIDASDGWWAAYTAVWNDASVTATGKTALLNELLNALKVEMPAQLRAKFGPQATQREATTAANADAGKIPAKAEAKKFSDALRGMPGFGALVDHVKAGKIMRGLTSLFGKKPVLAAWKDGGGLQDQITTVDPTPPTKKVETGIKNGSFAKKVAEADEFYKRLVEAEILAEVTRPKFKVHLEGAMTAANPGGYRAYQAGGEVHLAQDHETEIIVHEVGHAVENQLPPDRWQEIQLLLRSRHTAAKGQDKTAGDTGFGEARYEGDYPATGPYTSRAYDDAEGGTEVTAMTLEFLSQPGKIDAMLDKDPTQVAVVIRALRPKSYAAHAALRPFDKYLP